MNYESISINGGDMRADATYDEQQVLCRNASTLGYGAWKCRVGDVFTFRETYKDGSYSERIGRMLGRVAYAPALGETPEIKGYILALVLHGPATFAGIRWIKPAAVTAIRRKATDFARWFFSERLPYDAETIIKLYEYGTLSNDYISKADEHVKEWAT